MRITEVSYRKLVSTPGYGHQAVEIKAVLEQGEVPDFVLQNLKAWANRELGVNEPESTEMAQAKRELEDAEAKLEVAQRIWSEAEAKLDELRCAGRVESPGDVPF